MAGERVQVEGLRELRKALKTAQKGYEDVKAAGLEAAVPVEKQARVLVPKLTGALEGTIRSAGQASGAVVRAGFARVPYAGVIHFGWPGHNISPNPFLYDALDQRRSEVIKIYQERINTISKKV